MNPEDRPIAKLEPLEVLLLIILGSFSAVCLFFTRDYNPTAALFPRWVATATIVFMLVAVAIQLFGKSKPRSQQSDDDFVQPGPGAVSWTAVLALQAAYIVLIYLLGFTAATLLYLLVAPLQMGYRRWLIIAAQGVLLTLIISGSFIWFFHVRLPKGIVWAWW